MDALLPMAANLCAADSRTEILRTFVAAGWASNTQRAYANDWADFALWCQAQAVTALPVAPRDLAWYLAELASPSAGRRALKLSTIQRRLAGVVFVHRMLNQPSPAHNIEVQAVLRGIRRTLGRQTLEKQPLSVAMLRAILGALPDNLYGIRDRALLLLGFAGALRRSELVSLAVSDVRIVPEGLLVSVRRSKTDQEGRGYERGIAYGSNPLSCPVRALQQWLAAAAITDGALFRSIRHGRIQPRGLDGRDVARIVKRSATAAGFNPEHLSGHSLRAGLATSAAAAGVNERAIMQQTGHRSLQVMRRYIRQGSLFTDNASAQIGL